MKSALLWFVAIVAAVLLYQLAELRQTTNLSERVDQSQTDYYFANFRFVAYDLQNDSQFRLSGQHMNHADGEGVSRVDGPLIQARQAAETFLLKAESGEMYRSRQEFSLNGAVEVDAQSDTTVPMKIRTEVLRYDISNKRLIADQTVRIELGDAYLQADELDSKLDEPVINLTGHVKSTFTPNAE